MQNDGWGWTGVKISKPVRYLAKYQNRLVDQTFTTGGRMSQPTELSDTKCLCRDSQSAFRFS